MISGPTNLRTQGVKDSGNPVRNDGSPRTVLAVEPVEYFAVAFNDEQGQFRRMIVLRVGGTVYVPPGSIEWAANLKKGADWLQKDVERLAGQAKAPAALTSANLAAEDQVDVLGSDETETNKEKVDAASPVG